MYSDWAVHSLFIYSKKFLQSLNLLGFFEHMNNLRTVPRLGVDKFASMFAVPQVMLGACELANTLRLEAEEENFIKRPEKRTKEIGNYSSKGDISILR